MKITIQDFKPFKGSKKISIKPVTIIIGKNNAGKYQIILFNVRWTKNLDYGTYNPTDTDKLYNNNTIDIEVRPSR